MNHMTEGQSAPLSYIVIAFYEEYDISRAAKTKKDSGMTPESFVLVGRAGFEPATNGLKVRCSTS